MVRGLRPACWSAATVLLVTGAIAPVQATVSPSANGATQPGSIAYIERDVANIEAAFGRPVRQLETPGYLGAEASLLLQTEASQLAAQAGRPTHLALSLGGLAPEGAGDPSRVGWNGRKGRITPVSFAAADGALLQGHVFSPLHPRGRMPGVVIVTGSIQSAAGVYSWLAEDLAQAGYVALTFDVQGQGQSDTLPHDGSLSGVPSEQQSNFDNDTEDAISFMLSTPAHRYGGRVFNPMHAIVDHTPGRLAIIGHSTGAVTVSYLQGVDRRVGVAVALDKITATPRAIADDQALLGSLPGPVVPRVPMLGVQAEYGFEPQPYFLANCSSFEPCAGSPGQAPNSHREELTGFDSWQRAGVDTMVIVPRASTHIDFTDAPPILPASLWGQAMSSYYTRAWLDAFLKHRSKQPLLSRTPAGLDRSKHLSFYFRSAYWLGPDQHGELVGR